MRHLRTVLKPLGGVTGVFAYPVLIPHSYQPHPNQFSCLLQNTLWKDQESPQNELRDWKKIRKFCTEPLLMVYKIDSLFITLPTPNLQTLK